MFSIGEKVIFDMMISDDASDWFVDDMAFNYIRMLIGKLATVQNTQTHYEDDGTKTYFIDVEFGCGYILKRVNAIQFKLLIN